MPKFETNKNIQFCMERSNSNYPKLFSHYVNISLVYIDYLHANCFVFMIVFIRHAICSYFANKYLKLELVQVIISTWELRAFQISNLNAFRTSFVTLKCILLVA